MSMTDTQSSAMYCGAKPCRHLYSFEDDALRDVQPVQFIVKDVRQTLIKLPILMERMD